MTDETASPLEVEVFQILGDDAFLGGRDDGTGWQLAPAALERDWMDATAARYAYRCLPMTIANPLGLWLRNPVGFTATWRAERDRVEIAFDAAADFWGRHVTSGFGSGIVTFGSPVLFRTRPAGSRILVSGPPNFVKDGAAPLAGWIESDWAPLSFPMSWKLTRPGVPVRFERGDPVIHVLPVARDPGRDFAGSRVALRRLEDDVEVARTFRAWIEERDRFQERKARGEVPADALQEHYLRGLPVDGSAPPHGHLSSIRTPEIRDLRGSPLAGPGSAAERNSPVSQEIVPITTLTAQAPDSADSEPAARAAIASFGGFRLRAWRLHPRAARLGPAPRRSGAPALVGWPVFPPVDLDITWRGGRRFEWTALTPADPPQRLDFGGAGDGVVTIATGLLLETPPGWGVEVRDPLPQDGALAVEPDLLESDLGPRELVLRLRLRAQDRRVALRGADPQAASAIARLVPVRREAFEAEWLLGQLPAEARRER